MTGMCGHSQAKALCCEGRGVPLSLMLDQTGLGREYPDISASGSGVKIAILALLLKENHLDFDFSVQQQNICYEMHLVYIDQFHHRQKPCHPNQTLPSLYNIFFWPRHQTIVKNINQ